MQDIRAQHQMGKVVFVSDAGMVPVANLQALSKAGCELVVAARLRKLQKELLKELAEPSRYTAADKNGQRSLKLPYQGSRLVMKYCPRRAGKNKK